MGQHATPSMEQRWSEGGSAPSPIGGIDATKLMQKHSINTAISKQLQLATQRHWILDLRKVWTANVGQHQNVPTLSMKVAVCNEYTEVTRSMRDCPSPPLATRWTTRLTNDIVRRRASANGVGYYTGASILRVACENNLRHFYSGGLTDCGFSVTYFW